MEVALKANFSAREIRGNVCHDLASDGAAVVTQNIGAAIDEVARVRRSRAFAFSADDGSAGNKGAHLRAAAAAVRVDGLWLEFGVSTGASLQVIAQSTDHTIYGFDTCQGLPAQWDVGDGVVVPRGAFRGRPGFDLRNVHLVEGLFTETLPSFLGQHPGPVAFCHVDCDLYESARDALRPLMPRIVPGTILVFDELFNFPTYAEHEMRVLLELADAGMTYEYIGHTPRRYAASLIVTRRPYWSMSRRRTSS